MQRGCAVERSIVTVFHDLISHSREEPYLCYLIVTPISSLFRNWCRRNAIVSRSSSGFPEAFRPAHTQTQGRCYFAGVKELCSARLGVLMQTLPFNGSFQEYRVLAANFECAHRGRVMARVNSPFTELFDSSLVFYLGQES